MARARSKSRTPKKAQETAVAAAAAAAAAAGSSSKSKGEKASVAVETAAASTPTPTPTKRRRTRSLSSGGEKDAVTAPASASASASPSRASPRRRRASSACSTDSTAPTGNNTNSSGKKKSKKAATTPAKETAATPSSTKKSPLKKTPKQSKSPTTSSSSSAAAAAAAASPSSATKRGKNKAGKPQQQQQQAETGANDVTPMDVDSATASSSNNKSTKKQQLQQQQQQLHPPPTMTAQVHRVRHLDYIPSPVLAMASTTMSSASSSSSSSSNYLALSRQDGSIELMEATTIPEYASGKKFSSHLFPLSHIAGSKRAVAHSLAWVPMSTPTTTTTTSSSTSSTPSQTALVAASPDGTLWTVHCFAGASRQLQSRIASGGGGVFDLTTCTGIALPLVAAACQDGSIRIWNVVSSKDDNNGTHGFQLQEPPVVTLATAGAPILSVAWRCVRQQLSSSSSSETTVYTELYAGVADGTIRKYHLDLKVQQQGQQEDDASMTFQVLKQTPDLRMTVESRGRRTPTKVWTMQALDDGSLVTGNSLGQVQIWDTVTGTLMQSVTQTELKADVLKIVVNPSQTKLFASGVDSRVVCLERSTSSDRTWKFTTAQRPHTHDVKCMAIVDDALFTAGVDTKLCTYVVSDFAKRRPQVYYPWPSQSPVSTTSTTTTTATTTKSPGSSSRRILSMQRDNHIELYRLNPQEQDQQEKGSGLPATGSELIGEIALETQSNLSISSLSPNGHWLAAANATRLFLFRLNESDDDEDLEPEQVSLPKPLDRITVVALHFCGATNMLFVADSTHRVHVVDLSSTQDEDTISIVSTLRLPLKTGADIPISSLRTSENGKYLVAMTKSSQDGIHVFQRRAESSSSSSSELYSSYWMIPGLANARPAAVAFLGETQLAVATVSFQIYIFDLPGKKLSPWSEANGFPIQKWPSEISHRRDFPVRLFANPQNQSQLIMASFGAFVVVNLDGKLPKHCRMVPEMHVRRRRKRGRDEEALAAVASKPNPIIFAPPQDRNHGRPFFGNDPNARNCTVCLHYNSMLHLDFLGNNEMVVVEQPWLRVISTFPEALQRRVYGCN